MYISKKSSTFALDLTSKVCTMFKLLALRVLDGCADHIKKCLKIGDYYYFCNDFRFDIPEKVYRGSRYNKPLNESFFVPIETQRQLDTSIRKVTININAIVGKNGDGKSSTVELIIRLINNHIARSKKNSRRLGPIQIPEVYAELYMQLDNTIYCLYANKEDCGFKQIAIIPEDFSVQSFPIEEIPAKDNVFKSIFTLVSNYSLYAYNVNDFRKEWTDIQPQSSSIGFKECWLTRIFHRKDGFRVPLLLYPNRDKGIINVNNEAYLAKQRLLYLFVNPHDSSGSFKGILGKKAIGFWLMPSNENKLFERSIRAYFTIHLEEDHTLDWAIDPVRKVSTHILENTKSQNLFPEDFPDIQPEIQKLLMNEFHDVCETFNWIFGGVNFPEEQRVLYHQFLDYTINTLKLRPHKASNVTSFVKSVSSLKRLIKKYYSAEKYKEVFRMFPSFIGSDYEAYAKYNLRQIARLHTIFSIALRYNIDTHLLARPYELLTNKEHAQLYKIYKTLSIFENYQGLSTIGKQRKGLDLSLEYTDNDLSNRFMQLERDTSEGFHFTRKLVQIENYLKAVGDIYDMPDLETPYTHEDAKIKPLSSISDFYGAPKVDLYHLIPPIFEYDIVFQEGNSFMEMDTLSSGEKQLLNTIGSIIYYLQMTDIAQPTYNSINLILEEIELYFHPEFQRLLINRIIEQIYNVQWKHIENINITFVTHSPFVLSDIPKCNVLFLKDGKSDYQMQENTFGANIHSLLKNGFFLPNLPMGEFAYQKINEWFRQFSENEFDKTEESIARLREEIAIVGEPYLREQLYKSLKSQVP